MKKTLIATFSMCFLSLACGSYAEEVDDIDASVNQDDATDSAIDSSSPFNLCDFTESEYRTRVFEDPSMAVEADVDSTFEVEGTVSQVAAGKITVTGTFVSGETNEPRQVTLRFDSLGATHPLMPLVGTEVKIKSDALDWGDASALLFTQLYSDDTMFVQGGHLFSLNTFGQPVLPEAIFDASQSRQAGEPCSIRHHTNSGECWITYTPMEVALRTEPVVWAGDGDAQVVEWNGHQYYVIVASYHVAYEQSCPDYPVDDPDRQLNFDYETHIGFAVLVE